MKDRNLVSFGMGLLFGLGVCLLLWYWQKSLSGEEGALDLLDELARTKAALAEKE